MSKQELAQLLRCQLKGKCGNSLRSDIRISNPLSWPCRPCGPLRSQKFCHRRQARTLGCQLARKVAFLVKGRWCEAPVGLESFVARHTWRNKKSFNSKNDGLQGNTGTRCAQTSVFLILQAVLFCPADRLASKSFAKYATLRRWLF